MTGFQVTSSPLSYAVTSLGVTGTTAVTGTPGALDSSGPYLIERQSLSIDYTRVPYGSFAFTPNCITLSGVTLGTTGINYNIDGTILVADVRADYSRTKSNDFYSVTAYQQPQKFEIRALGIDANGVNYGTITTGTLGPMGSVETIKEFYKRVPWIDGTHTEVTETMRGKTYFASDEYSARMNQVTATVDSNGMDKLYYKWLVSTRMAGTFNNHVDEIPKTEFYDYYIGGSYNTAKEGYAAIARFIDNIGFSIRKSKLYKPIATVVASQVIGDQGFDEYDPGRHDYD